MTKRTLTSIEIPQADSLENVRRVVSAIASGASSRKEISEKTDISVRHIDYAIHAAKSLGFLAATEALSMTDSGSALAATGRGSPEEREQLRAAIKANDVVSMLAPDLLDDSAPSKAALTERIQEACPDLSEATAARRAQTLLAWRSQALSTAISSPVEDETVEDEPAEDETVEDETAAEEKAAPARKVAKPAAKKAAKPAAKKAAPKKAAAKKAAPKKAARPAAKKAAPAKKAARPAAKKAAKKAAPARKTAAKKGAKADPKKAAKKVDGATAAAPTTAPAVEPGPAPIPAEAPPAREITYELDPGAGGES